jgi:uncharacterized protein YceK
MKSRVAMAVGLAVLAGLSGCGTAANTVFLNEVEGGKRAYGGVRADWEIVRERGEEGSGANLRAPLWAAIDMPFSLVADTVTLPYILGYQAGLFGREDTTHPGAGKPSNWLHPNNANSTDNRATTPP